jgi:GNAT superfamily N-acetyltransferase
MEIRPVAETEIALLEKRFPQGGVAQHAERFGRRLRGEAAYLAAWPQELPVGHTLIHWGSSRDGPVADRLRFPCPDLEDLFVLSGRRSQGIGGQLPDFAERLASEHGCGHLGLSVAAETNASARRLYGRLGCHDARFGEYVERANISIRREDLARGKRLVFIG